MTSYDSILTGFLLVPHFEDILSTLTSRASTISAPSSSKRNNRVKPLHASCKRDWTGDFWWRSLWGVHKGWFWRVQSKKKNWAANQKSSSIKINQEWSTKTLVSSPNFLHGLSFKIQGFSGFQAPENPKSTSLSSTFCFLSLIAPSSSMDVDARKWCGSFHLRKKGQKSCWESNWNGPCCLAALLPCCLAALLPCLDLKI